MFVYIIFSDKLNQYYIGESQNVEKRLELHNAGVFNKSSTKKAKDWKVVYKLECKNRGQARKIESHIKRMKSRKYIENIIRYEEIGLKLLSKY